MNISLLMADSDVEFTQLVKHYLEPEGYTLTIVYDGELACKKALNQSFDAIILDIALPKKMALLSLKPCVNINKPP